MINAKQGAIWWHPKLSQAEFAKLIGDSIPADQPAWHLTADITQTEFSDFDIANAATLIAKWPQGKVFCPACEIRWRHLPNADAYEVFVLREDDLVLPGFQQISGPWRVVAPGANAALAAWGSVPDGAPKHIRAESRLPGQAGQPSRLVYPESCRDGKLKCVYYCAPSGEAQLIRLTEVA